MKLFEKINTLEELFTQAKDDLSTLEQTLAAKAQELTSSQVAQIKLEAQESFSKALEQTKASLSQAATEQVQALFTQQLDALALKVSQNLNLQDLSAQIAQDFAAQNSQELAKALEQALAREDITQQLEALKTQAQELVSEFAKSLEHTKQTLQATAQDTLQTLLETSAPKLLESLDLQPIAQELERQITPQIDTANIERQATEQTLQKINELIQNLSTKELQQTLERQAIALARGMLQADEIIKDRYECALRLQSIKCFATQEIVTDIIEQSAKRKNYEDIIENALKNADKKIYLSI
ncbi:hypothetical protein [Helicobacter sp.]|uniref:hypothetical protein n=1 Tax=Helicobacter sp. TaxID=218 RepID=UPI00388E3C00